MTMLLPRNIIDLRPRLKLPAHIAFQFEKLPLAERSAIVERGINDGHLIALTASQSESLETAIGLLTHGAQGGGKIGFRSEEKYLHQYADLAEELKALLHHLKGSE